MNLFLEKCPHCGSDAALCNMMRMTWWVQCTNSKCGAQTRHCGTANGAEIAIQLWNDRYILPLVSVDAIIRHITEWCTRFKNEYPDRYFTPDQIVYIVKKAIGKETEREDVEENY